MIIDQSLTGPWKPAEHLCVASPIVISMDGQQRHVISARWKASISKLSSDEAMIHPCSLRAHAALTLTVNHKGDLILRD